MATFKTIIKKENRRSDGTWKVFIRFTHNRKVRFIPTTMYVGKKDVTASFKIKNANIIDRCDDLIRNYRERINELGLEFNDIDIDTVVAHLKKRSDKRGISFTDFAMEWMARHTEKKGIANYKTSLNAFRFFMGRENILCEEVTSKTLKAFEESLGDRPRAQSMYPNSIKTIFNAAREFYNDEDNDIIRIKHSLDRYRPVEQNVAEKRALDVNEIRKIFALPYDNLGNRGGGSRHDLALDCFMLSFCLMGMNSADLFNATEIDGDTIIYNRTKTKDRRKDKAELHVQITDYIRPLVDKYRGDARVFNFHKRFSSMKSFNRAINIGLKEIGKEAGIEHLQFYAARHSMASIAVNDVEISKYIVNDMLNHTDPALKITELYIKRDFRAINKANVKLLDYVFEKGKGED